GGASWWRVSPCIVILSRSVATRAGSNGRRGAERATGERPLLRHLLLAGDRHRLALAGAGVGVRALATHRQAAPMAQSAIAAEIHQPLDVHRHLAPEVALDAV